MEIIGIVSFALLFIYVIIVITFINGWRNLKSNPITNRICSTRVSILVAARNEEQHIANAIEDLLGQNYPSSLFEIIIVNDHSTDETGAIVATFKDRNVRLIELNESEVFNSYKKKAIQTAIAQSTGELIITTDADCRMGADWLKTVVNFYEENDYKMISSPVAYFDENNIFERCQALEFSYLIGLGASTIGNNKPTTCNGANLAYEREAFHTVNGFAGIDDLASGDDELLLHKIVAKFGNKVGFLKNKDAVVYTRAKATLKAFIQQRKRWASKSTRYKTKWIVLLGLVIWLFNLSMVVNAICSIIFMSSPFLKVFLVQIIIKIAIEMIFLLGVTSFFKRKELLILQPLVSFLHVIYIVYIGIAGNSGKYNWKDRMVK